MDAFYESVETSLLAFGFALGLAAFAALALPRQESVPFPVTLPMLTVTAVAAPPLADTDARRP
ncbi:hypothetical protein [Methylobacterium trifolii]|uniref:Uncharacterized protein n=1 Tax=Methylobacterium trifolii TaxID=1003092 RepID=A0ABQ4TWH2_9HYPH|nr:hypothetical protein [Methylobacterium trifolii]GJE58357.1 hypothetical protein MPOCJGCO_0436 [Methylobacterium trifolii]